MSTLTKNYNFIKPELTDAADITATNSNWDKVDSQLGACRIHSYTALTQFGLSDAEMSTSDFTSNIDRIITTLDGSAVNLMLIVQNDVNPNLHASLIAKLNEDTSLAFSTDYHAGWISIRFSGEAYRPVIIETNLETAKYYSSIWTCVYNKGTSSNQMSKFRTVDMLSSDQYGTELPAAGTVGRLFFKKV